MESRLFGQLGVIMTSLAPEKVGIEWKNQNTNQIILNGRRQGKGFVQTRACVDLSDIPS
jgi:hypothetical protein